MLLQVIGQHVADTAHHVAMGVAQAAAGSSDAVHDPTFTSAEDQTRVIFSWLRLAVETIGALVIGAGVAVGVVQFINASLRRTPDGYTDVRLRLARFLAVALEFQLGADLLSTAIAPSWDTIRNLAAIAIIRTGLNYFLGKEMNEEAARLKAAGATTQQAARRATGVGPQQEAPQRDTAATGDGTRIRV